MSVNAIIVRNLRDLPNGKKGLWINNLVLKGSLDVGTKVIRKYDYENKLITLTKTNDNDHNLTISYRKSTPETPILDLKNNEFHEMFKDVNKVEVHFMENKVVIKIAEIEQNEIRRKLKTTYKTFELFCGGGTLSHQFKLAGFESAGGVEYEDKCMEYFVNNHGAKGTIVADIKDVTADMYARNKDIHLVLAGIPCPNFSRSNKLMQEALVRDRNGIATESDLQLLESRNEAEYLTFYVLEALRAMNPRTIVIEEVVEYISTNAYSLLKYILKTMNYEITETISEGSHTKRKRWCLVANTGSSINLDDLIPNRDVTLAEVLDIDINTADWKELKDIKRLESASKKATIGIRSALATDIKCNTFTCHATRHTEPCLKHPTEDLYMEFTNEDIAKIHGLRGYKLDGNKTTSRIVLGNGVTDMFYHIAERIKDDIAFSEGRLF